MALLTLRISVLNVCVAAEQIKSMCEMVFQDYPTDEHTYTYYYF